MERHFFRCTDCLTVWAADVERAPARTDRGSWGAVQTERETVAPVIAAGCPLKCGSEEVEAMGAVNATGSLTKIAGVEYDCDASCAHARGPNCECPCGGMNHGAGILATYVKVEFSAVPTVSLRLAPKTEAQARERAAEWRTVLASLEETVLVPLRAERKALLDKKAAGTWLTQDEFGRLCDLGRAINKALKVGEARTHAGRMKAVEALRQEVRS